MTRKRIFLPSETIFSEPCVKFGDFVTCEFWDELWLNEAFASYITYVGLEHSSNRQRYYKIILNK